MARGTVLAEIALSGDKRFRQAVEAAGDQMDDAGGDALQLGGALKAAGSALSRTGRDALGLAGSLNILQGRTDEASDELRKAAATAVATGGAFSSLALSTDGASIAFGTLSTVTTLSLIPSLATLSTTLAPIAATMVALTTAAGSLAGAFGAIIGSGILAFGRKRAKQNEKQLQQVNARISQLKQLAAKTGMRAEQEKRYTNLIKRQVELRRKQLDQELSKQQKAELKTLNQKINALGDAFQTQQGLTAAQKEELETLQKKRKSLKDTTTIMGALGAAMSDLQNELVPIISSFGQRFIPLIEDALQSIPALVQSMVDSVGSTDEFAQTLREFGKIGMRVLPALTGFMFEFARDALPAFKRFTGFLLAEGPGAFRAMMASVRELRPQLMRLLGATIEFLPVLLEFGTNVATVVVPALTDLIGELTDLMRWVNGLDKGTRDLVIGVTILAPVVLAAAAAIGSLVTAVSALAPAFSAAVSIGGTLVTIIGGLSAVTLGIIGAVAFFAGAWITNWKDIRGFTTTVIDGITAMVLDLKGVIVETLHALGLLAKGSDRVDFSEVAKRGGQEGVNTGTPWLVNPNTTAGDLRGGQTGRVGATGFGHRARAPVRERVVEKVATITVENGEIVAKMDERAQKKMKDQAQQSKLE